MNIDLKKIIDVAVLTPMSYLYGAGVFIRNKMFDWKILKSVQFNVPVISVGNIAVGGTGKTPHTEYIIFQLCDTYHIGMISRGYKRQTSGYVQATPYTTPFDIGDEPYQIYQKFGKSIKVAVCEKRVEGIRKLLATDPSINLILLDDAFQHRYVKPSLSIVLTEYNRPFFNDRLLPAGRLRESAQGIKDRADFIIVTKCPDDMKPVDFMLCKKQLDLYPYHKLFFSKFKYQQLSPIFRDDYTYVPSLEMLTERDTILAVTGIANPLPLIRFLKSYKATVKIMQFPDHHSFTRNDIDDIEKTFNSLEGHQKFLMTTEKDAVRIANNPYIPAAMKKHFFFQPIIVEFINKDADFNAEIKHALLEKRQ